MLEIIGAITILLHALTFDCRYCHPAKIASYAYDASKFTYGHVQALAQEVCSVQRHNISFTLRPYTKLVLHCTSKTLTPVSGGAPYN